jgi:hypothetical protein
MTPLQPHMAEKIQTPSNTDLAFNGKIQKFRDWLIPQLRWSSKCLLNSINMSIRTMFFSQIWSQWESRWITEVLVIMIAQVKLKAVRSSGAWSYGNIWFVLLTCGSDLNLSVISGEKIRKMANRCDFDLAVCIGSAKNYYIVIDHATWEWNEGDPLFFTLCLWFYPVKLSLRPKSVPHNEPVYSFPEFER